MSGPVWFDGDPYMLDGEGEYVEVHHAGERGATQMRERCSRFRQHHGGDVS